MAKYSNGLEDEIDLTESSIKVLEGRYLKRDDSGKAIETAHDMFQRVAYNIAEADKIYDTNASIEKTAENFYQVMSNLYFLPNSPTLMNAGRELQQLSGCFVLPIDDSIVDIFEIAKQGALVHKSGGGTGYSFSRIRPNGDYVKSTSGIASGPISFMDVFNKYTDVVKQGGTRRGANMGILRVDHPDIIEFIDAKNKPNDKNKKIADNFKESKSLKENIEKLLVGNYQLNNLNISVALTDRFMDAVERDEEYELIHPATKKVTRKLKAREVLDKIAENAWKNGEPGVIFIDEINRHNPTPEVGEIESTNPCGEQPLLPYESCNLGSIDVSKFVDNKKIDFGRLEEVVHTAVHFLDNVIDMNKFPLPQIEKMTKANRKIGLGVMGFADMLIQLGVPYNSQDAILKAEEVMDFIQVKSKEASAKLAEKRGNFPNIDKSIYKGQLMRNATTTTIAPTGTIGVITGSSQGIEPLYAIVYKRTTPQFTLFEPNKIFKKIAQEKGFYSESLLKEIFGRNGTIKEFDSIPKEVRDLFITAYELNPEEHVKIQAAFQKHVDNAVSKTINFPESAKVEDVKNSFILAYKNNCKGVTVYRNNSSEEQVLTTGKKTSNRSLVSMIVEEVLKKPRPERVEGLTLKQTTPFGNMYPTINKDMKTGNLYELFLAIGKGGGDVTAMAEGFSRALSLLFKVGVPPEIIIEQFEGIGGKSQIFDKGQAIGSIPDAIAQAIKKYLEQTGGNGNDKSKKDPIKSGNLCPRCGSPLIKQEGCEKCSDPECLFEGRCG